MWNTIRTFGDLHILTRASYIMLIFVPLLAGVWPAVKSSINKYNNVVIESRMALDSASNRLEFIASTVIEKNTKFSELNNIIESLEQRIDTIIQDYSLKSIENNMLPSVWALGFLASLAVMIGHLLYQAFAPPLIKRITIRDFVNENLKNFVEHPSDSQLKRAKVFAEYSEEKYVKRSTEEDFNEFSNKISNKMKPVERSEEDRKAEEKRRKELGIIEEGAIGEYLQNVSRNKPAAYASGFFYSIGLILILYIVITQTNNVIEAAWG